jgi:hypothetical protein
MMLDLPQGSRIKKSEVILNGASARAKVAEPTRSEEPRGIQERCPVFSADPAGTHGILRLRAAPPSPARHSAQDDTAILLRELWGNLLDH